MAEKSFVANGIGKTDMSSLEKARKALTAAVVAGGLVIGSHGVHAADFKSPTVQQSTNAQTLVDQKDAPKGYHWSPLSKNEEGISAVDRFTIGANPNHHSERYVDTKKGEPVAAGDMFGLTGRFQKEVLLKNKEEQKQASQEEPVADAINAHYAKLSPEKKAQLRSDFVEYSKAAPSEKQPKLLNEHPKDVHLQKPVDAPKVTLRPLEPVKLKTLSKDSDIRY